MVLKGLIRTDLAVLKVSFSTLGGCGSLERTDFNSFYFGGCGSL